MYEGYWSREDRWGSHSFDDARGLADQVLGTCGAGRTLDVGCGMGLLVRTLLSRGVDAVGLDVAPLCVEAGNRGAPGRFVEGSALSLPFPNGSFDTVISTDVMEHLAPEDVDRAVAELARVARSFVFVRLSTAPDRDATWHLTVKPREWWEERFIAGGLRKHAASARVVPYHALDQEGHQVSLLFEKIPERAAARHPLSSLRAGRDLHMDMLREAGRRSDAHAARYTYAATMVRPGDVVLDAACGLGYGSSILARTTGAARVIGVDADGAAVRYARDCYADDGRAPGVIEFRKATLPDLSFLGDRSVDFVASFETLEHVEDPAALLREFARVLTPGGRVVVSVPNDWTDETGKDPNPHHLHVYTWDRLGRELGREFLLERASAQTAGGGMKLSDRPRAIVDAVFAADVPGARGVEAHALAGPPEAEWWLAVGMKDPVGAGKEGYRESAYGGAPTTPEYHVTAFEREYDNPWLVRSMVSIGSRATRPALLAELAGRVLAAARPGSADAGAALCVLGYRAVEGFGEGSVDAASVAELQRRLAEYDSSADDTPHGWRWRISNQYVSGLLSLCQGDRRAARGWFESCARMDATRFSPLLASKTVDAAFQAGALAAADGDAQGAADLWTRGIEEARRAVSSPWLNVVGDPSHPLVFGLPEVATVADLASRCAYGLDMLHRRPAGSAQVWAASQTQTYGDMRRWAHTLLRALGWRHEERERLRRHGDQQARSIVELREALADQKSSERQRLTAMVDERVAGIVQESASLKGAVERLTAARAWLESQLQERTEAYEKLRTWTAELTRGRDWLDEQVKLRDGTIAELRAWVGELTSGRDWLESQVKARDATIAELRAWAEELVKGRDWLDEQRRAMGERAQEREREAAELSARAAHSEREAGTLRTELSARHAEVADLQARVRTLEDRLKEAGERARVLTARVEALDRCLTVRVRPEDPPGTPDESARGVPGSVEPGPAATNDPVPGTAGREPTAGGGAPAEARRPVALGRNSE